MRKDTMMKTKILEYIKQQTGLEITLCDYFTDIKKFRGKPYFNIILDNKISESYQLPILERLANNSAVIFELQQNGPDRLSVVCYKNWDVSTHFFKTS